MSSDSKLFSQTWQVTVWPGRHCVALRENAQAADNVVALALSEPSGLLRIACPVTLAQTTVGPLLPLYLERYPKVRVDMRVSNRVVDLVEEGVDVALRVRQTLDDSGSLVVKRLAVSQTLLVARSRCSTWVPGWVATHWSTIWAVS